MDLAELLEKQRAFDQLHGWVVDRTDSLSVLQGITDDVVGLVGELGEFANHVKKIKLRANGDGVVAKVELDARRGDLSEELIDTLVYLVRIATHLDIELEDVYLNKLEVNRQRYISYEKQQP